VTKGEVNLISGTFPPVYASYRSDIRRLTDLPFSTMEWSKIGSVITHPTGIPENESLIIGLFRDRLSLIKLWKEDIEESTW